jgi:glycosyltransferase involved in cell wall biosynthesis
MRSSSDGSPIVGLQARTFGLAFVVKQAGGFVELVELAVNGFLIDSYEERDFCIALHQLLRSPTLLKSCRKANREKTLKFDLKAVIGAYEGLLLEVSDGSAQA